MRKVDAVNRRTLLKALPVAAMLGATGHLPALHKQYGLVDVAVTPRAQEFRCWLDGVEITNRCRAANDQEGWAEVYTEQGTLKRLTGSVVLRHEVRA